MTRYEDLLERGPRDPYEPPPKRLIRFVDRDGYHLRYEWMTLEEFDRLFEEAKP